MRLKATLCSLLAICHAGRANENRSDFNKDFKFSVATSSYQVEGAWNLDGKGESVWDRITHHHTAFINNASNGDVACDSYHKYKEDVQLIKNLGVQYYRFSIAWTRLYPTGIFSRSERVNPKGVAYYNSLIDELIKNDITPQVTIYHWDLPQSLQDQGGFQNPDIVSHFVEYANTLFALFGDRVRSWYTFNEPNNICLLDWLLHTVEGRPSGMKYICTRHILLAHARTYRLYQQHYQRDGKDRGVVSMVVDTFWYDSATDSDEDIAATHRYLQFMYGRWMHPIYIGDFPPIVQEYVAIASQRDGSSESKLPKFSQEEVKMIKGTNDELALNYYSSKVVRFNMTSKEDNYEADAQISLDVDPTWTCSPTSTWLCVTPWNLRKLLKYIKETYKDPEIVITENGYGDFGDFNDTDRVNYIKQHLIQIVRAISIDHVRITGYTSWSLLDNFEWTDGYMNKFGLHSVDFDDPHRSRKPRASATMYKNLVRTRRIPN